MITEKPWYEGELKKSGTWASGRLGFGEPVLSAGRPPTKGKWGKYVPYVLLTLDYISLSVHNGGMLESPFPRRNVEILGEFRRSSSCSLTDSSTAHRLLRPQLVQ
jgi:hypothetical protein